MNCAGKIRGELSAEMLRIPESQSGGRNKRYLHRGGGMTPHTTHSRGAKSAAKANSHSTKKLPVKECDAAD